MSLTTHTFSILTLEREVLLMITKWLMWHQVSWPPKQEERAWKRKGSSLMPLSYPRGALSKKTIPSYLTDQNKVTRSFLDYSLAKPFISMNGLDHPVPGHLAIGKRKRGLAIGRQPTMHATLTLCLLSEASLLSSTSARWLLFPPLSPADPLPSCNWTLPSSLHSLLCQAFHLFMSKSCLLG